MGIDEDAKIHSWILIHDIQHFLLLPHRLEEMNSLQLKNLTLAENPKLQVRWGSLLCLIAASHAWFSHLCMFYRWAWCYPTDLPLKEDGVVKLKGPQGLAGHQTASPAWIWVSNTNWQTVKQTHIHKSIKEIKIKSHFVNTSIIRMSLSHWVQRFWGRNRLFLTRWRIE